MSKYDEIRKNFEYDPKDTIVDAETAEIPSLCFVVNVLCERDYQ